jgi:hypothetical protein
LALQDAIIQKEPGRLSVQRRNRLS